MRLNELLGTEFPIIQGGMANIATGEFAAACSNAGALGMIATGGWDGDRLRREIRRAKELTDKPFGVNLMLMSPYADDIARVILEERVRVVTTGAGNPGKYIPAWKEAGIKVMPVVAVAVLARRLERYGVDAFIAEGTESGGHVGEMTTMALVPQVIDAVNVPVIAAGGIADGRQLAAAYALGAIGAQVGTCLLASVECPIHENYKRAILKAKDSDTVVTGRSIGGPVRVLKNKMSRTYLELEKRRATLEELESVTLGGLRRAVLEGDVENGSVMTGQVAGMLHEIKPVRQIFAELVAGGDARIKELAAQV
ncbi:enoyl-[acyl-carrier-protein] reductase [Oscillibacter valericigenes Sjm18-20]|nr:enoyl-[acyl-carrier-protein] reductase [Oscillibacter valericigenes Sjm18-20]